MGTDIGRAGTLDLDLLYDYLTSHNPYTRALILIFMPNGIIAISIILKNRYNFGPTPNSTCENCNNIPMTCNIGLANRFQMLQITCILLQISL